jgi:hypothetical protein
LPWLDRDWRLKRLDDVDVNFTQNGDTVYVIANSWTQPKDRKMAISAEELDQLVHAELLNLQSPLRERAL